MKKIYLKNVFNKYIILFILFVLLVLFSLTSDSLTSKTNSAYKTVIDSNSSSVTVSKWDINSLDELGNNSDNVSMLGEGFKLEDTDDAGNWLFQVENKSEVDAIINKNSKIRIRIDSENFKSNDITGFGWDFLKTTDADKGVINISNPIVFRVYMYDGSLQDILTYKDTNGNEIDFNTYLTKTDKTIYTEIINDNKFNTETKKLVFETKDITALKKDVEEVESQIIAYYYFDFDLTEISNALVSMPMKGNNTKTFRVEWEISQTSSNVDMNDAKYEAYYKQINKDGFEEGNYQTVNVNGTTYYVGFKLLDNYEYYNYLCKIGYGDEPSFIFDSNVAGSTIEVPYSNLTLQQIEQIEAYPDSLGTPLGTSGVINTTDEIIRKFIEKKNYYVYGDEYVVNQEAFLNSLGYLEYGLSCRIIFDIKVDQVN